MPYRGTRGGWLSGRCYVASGSLAKKTAFALPTRILSPRETRHIRELNRASFVHVGENP
jgi:hypothetical protein